MAKKDEKIEEKAPPTIEEVVIEDKEAQAKEQQDALDAAKKAEEEKANEVEIDIDVVKKETQDETLKKVEEIVTPLKEQIESLKKEQSPEEKDDYDKFVEDYEAKNGTKPDWKHVATFLEDRAIARIDAREKEKADAKAKEEADAAQSKEEQADKNFKYWQGQLEEMEKAGKLPKMEKPEKGDKGFDARVTLYGHMQSTWAQGSTPVTNLYEVYDKFYKAPNQQPAGFDAPVSLGGQGGSGAKDDEELSYADIHKGAQDLESFAIDLIRNRAK